MIIKLNPYLVIKKTYRILKRDPTQKTEKELNRMLSDLKRQKKVDDNLYNKLPSSDGLPPRFYGLHQIHKQGYPLRPIVSFITFPTYNLSKFMGRILKSLTGSSEDTVKNSTEFCNYIFHVKLQDDEELVSFDVISLFTSIPKDLAVLVANYRLVNDDTLTNRSTIPAVDLVNLLKFCLSTTNFKYNGIHYQQIFEIAMGSPMSAIMANMVMEDIEQRALSSTIFQPIFWKRYVDDECSSIKSMELLAFQD